MTCAAYRPCCMATGATPGYTTGSPPGCRTRTMSPRANTSGWPGSVRSGSTVTRPGPVALGPGEVGKPPGEPGCRHAGRPDHGAARDALVPDGDAVRIDAGHGAAGHDGHPELLERPCGLRRERRRETRQHTVGRLDEQDAGVPRIDGAEVAAQGVAGELTDLTGHLDPGRAAADDDEGEPGLPPRRVGLPLGRFERREEPATDDERALERLHLGCLGAPLLVAEVGVLRAAGRR